MLTSTSATWRISLPRTTKGSSRTTIPFTFGREGVTFSPLLPIRMECATEGATELAAIGSPPACWGIPTQLHRRVLGSCPRLTPFRFSLILRETVSVGLFRAIQPQIVHNGSRRFFRSREPYRRQGGLNAAT